MRTALHFSILSEVTALSTAVLTGMLLALLYRIFAYMRLFFAAGKRLTFVFDLFYVICSLILFFLYGFLFLGGEVRLYALTAAAAGFILWQTFEKIFQNFFKKYFHFKT